MSKSLLYFMENELTESFVIKFEVLSRDVSLFNSYRIMN